MVYGLRFMEAAVGKVNPNGGLRVGYMSRKYVDIKLTTDFNFEWLLSTNPKMKSYLEDAVRTVMWDARDKATEKAKPYFKDSAHDTHRAIRNTIYKKVIGGELNILALKRALRQGHVAASRRGRTANTERILSYTGVDRTFIFRFNNDSTNPRWTTNMDGHKMYRQSVDERPKNRTYVYPDKLGGRGGSAKRNGNTVGMFQRIGDPIMLQAGAELQKYIDKIIDSQLNNK